MVVVEEERYNRVVEEEVGNRVKGDRKEDIKVKNIKTEEVDGEWLDYIGNRLLFNGLTIY